MNKKKLLATAFAAALSLSQSQAASHHHGDMEKCRAINSEGVGIIKAHQGQCGTSSHSCSGKNEAGDPEAWILVPNGECEKINNGDFSGLTSEMKSKLDMKLVKNPTTKELEKQLDKIEESIDKKNIK